MTTVRFAEEKNIIVEIASCKNVRITYDNFSLEEKKIIATVRNKQVVPLQVKPSGTAWYKSGLREAFDGLGKLLNLPNDYPDDIIPVSNYSEIDYPVEWSEPPFTLEDSRKRTRDEEPCTPPHLMFLVPLEIPEPFGLTAPVTTPTETKVSTGPRRSKRRRTPTRRYIEL